MCFRTSDITKYIEEQDIVCYKTFNNKTESGYISSYLGFKYIKGKLYSLKSIKQKHIRKMTYSYRDEYTLKNRILMVFNIIPIYKRHQLYTEIGFHSYINKYPHFNTYYEEYIKCIIPKGATYYKNDYEYVSNKIIVL